MGLHTVEGIICPGIDKCDAISGERIADVVVHRVGIEVAVNAGDGDNNGFSPPLAKRTPLRNMPLTPIVLSQRHHAS